MFFCICLPLEDGYKETLTSHPKLQSVGYPPRIEALASATIKQEYSEPKFIGDAKKVALVTKGSLSLAKIR